jgi:hypothetical protein
MTLSGFMGLWILLGGVITGTYFYGKLKGYQELRDDLLNFIDKEL